MAFRFGGKIVTNGLVLYIDAANPLSYPGSGISWNDMSGNSNNTTLTNGPVFSNTNAGVITFDGSNDYAEATVRNTALEFQPTQPFSVFAWFRGPAAQGSGVIANMVDTSPYPGWDLFFNEGGGLSNTIAMHLISSWTTNAIKVIVTYNYANNQNKWIYFGYTYDGSCPTTTNNVLNSVNFYSNGQLYTTGKALEYTNGFLSTSETITYNSSQRFRVGSRWANGTASLPANVMISNIQIYNRALAGQEILQNYNALKSRFSL